MGQKETFIKVLRYIKRYWLYLAASVFMASVTVALTLYFPILTGEVIDLVIAPMQVDFPCAWHTGGVSRSLDSCKAVGSRQD